MFHLLSWMGGFRANETVLQNFILPVKTQSDRPAASAAASHSGPALAVPRLSDVTDVLASCPDGRYDERTRGDGDLAHSPLTLPKTRWVYSSSTKRRTCACSQGAGEK